MESLRIPRLIILLCSALLLATQVTGLHHHRHVDAGLDAGVESHVHLRDFGIHVPDAGEAGEIAAHGDGASHFDADVEIKPITENPGKVSTGVLTMVVLFAFLWLVVAPQGRRRRVHRTGHPQHPSHFVLRPPPRGPPLKLSIAR